MLQIFNLIFLCLLFTCISCKSEQEKEVVIYRIEKIDDSEKRIYVSEFPSTSRTSTFAVNLPKYMVDEVKTVNFKMRNKQGLVTFDCVLEVKDFFGKRLASVTLGREFFSYGYFSFSYKGTSYRVYLQSEKEK